MLNSKSLLKRPSIQGRCWQIVRDRHWGAKKNYYDVLGISPKATQKDVKSAFYELSKVYHPDKNTSMQATERFREVSEAYDVLGNYDTRKKYDKGMYTSAQSVIYEGTSPKSRENTKDEENSGAGETDEATYAEFVKKPRYTGRSHIYNFDEYYRAHYGRVLHYDIQRKRYYEYVKEKEEELKAQREKVIQYLKMQALFAGVILLALGLLHVFGAYVNYETNLDNKIIVIHQKDDPKEESDEEK